KSLELVRMPHQVYVSLLTSCRKESNSIQCGLLNCSEGSLVSTIYFHQRQLFSPIRPENHPAAVVAVGKVRIQRLFTHPFGRRILRDRRDASARRRPFVSDAGIPASPSPRCAPRSARKADRRDRGY